MGALFIALGVPLLRRKIPQNSWYGVRVGATMTNKEVWYEANEICGRDLIVFGVATILLAGGLSFFAWPDAEVYAFVLAAAITVGALILAAHGMGAARKIHQRVVGDGGSRDGDRSP